MLRRGQVRHTLEARNIVEASIRGQTVLRLNRQTLLNGVVVGVNIIFGLWTIRVRGV